MRDPRLSLVALASLMGLLAGCATPGPNHVYSLASARSQMIEDAGPGPVVTIPGFVAPGEEVTGLAYDPYTDHLFLRLSPGNRIRVVDRPARQIKREFTIAGLPGGPGGDMAVRPRDGHLFLIDAAPATLVETDRFGKFIRRFALAGLEGSLVGIAFDPAQNHLWALADDRGPRLYTYTLDGKRLHQVRLHHEDARGHLALDPQNGEIHIACASEGRIAVFDQQGNLLRTVPTSDGNPVRFLDAGQRSFVRVF